MKKVFCNSKLAKFLLFGTYSTITLAAWVFTKYGVLSQRVINHECTHVRQWAELTIASGLLIWIGLLMFDYSAWWLLLSGIVFYIWYVLEYLVRRVMGLFVKSKNKQNTAYRLVSFEQEARLAESDSNYLENSVYFSWLGFYKRNKKNT